MLFCYDEKNIFVKKKLKGFGRRKWIENINESFFFTLRIILRSHVVLVVLKTLLFISRKAYCFIHTTFLVYLRAVPGLLCKISYSFFREFHLFAKYNFSL